MSRILIVGGTGFIGRHLAAVLTDAGHEVMAAGRRGLDLVRDDVATMTHRLAGTKVVINAAGLVRGRGANTLAEVHAAGPRRLFEACVQAGVGRLIHISALGAASSGETAYQRTKGEAEDALHELLVLDRPRLEGCVLRPSVVIGRGGASTVVLSALAALPLTPRLGPWQVQPVHVDDLAELVARLVEHPGPLPRSLEVVGPEPMTTDQLVAALRRWLGLPVRPLVPVPEAVLDVMGALGGRLMDGPINRDVVVMLKRGNLADAGPMAEWLGRAPRRLDQALARHPATEADRRDARLFFVRPVLRWSIGLLWLATGLLSLGIYPLEGSYHLLAEVGLQGPAAQLALYGGALVDLLLGGLLLAGVRPAAVGAAMLATMAVFSIIAVRLPAEYWLHPFAPLLKNLPVAAATLAMMALEA